MGFVLQAVGGRSEWRSGTIRCGTLSEQAGFLTSETRGFSSITAQRDTDGSVDGAGSRKSSLLTRHSGEDAWHQKGRERRTHAELWGA